MRVKPATFVQQTTQTATHGAVVLDRAFVMDSGDKAFVGNMQKSQSRRLVNTATFCFNDAVLDLIAHTETMATANGIGFVHEFNLIGKFFSINRHWPTFMEANTHGLGSDHDVFAIMSNSHDGINNLHRGRKFFKEFGFVRCAPNIGVRAVRLLRTCAIGQFVG